MHKSLSLTLRHTQTRTQRERERTGATGVPKRVTSPGSKAETDAETKVKSNIRFLPGEAEKENTA